ncbi:MAG: ATP-binding cassette domain-containing protein, partial [Clostridia bacterium]|nr:ATP-binding cassette domain-containing protein [Clostridia bacterium]
WENITLPLGLEGMDADPAEVDFLLNALSITEKKRALPSQLSGGQQQRVAIARALITKPHIILADEPTGNLDSKTGMDVMTTLLSLNKQFSQTIVVITHNEELAQMTSRQIHIEDGRIVSDNGGIS